MEKNIELTSLISPTSRFLVSEPEPFASGGGPELVGVHGAEMVSAAATALPVTINHIRYFSAPVYLIHVYNLFKFSSFDPVK